MTSNATLRADLAGHRRRRRAVTWDWLLPSWPLVIGLLAFGWLLVRPLAMLHDPDTYMHIAAGRWMLAHWALPAHDPFSHSMPGAFWLTPEWLAQSVMAAVYEGFGWSGLALFTAASLALSVALLMRFLLRRFEPMAAAVATVAALALLLAHTLARPHIVALPLLVLWTGWLLAARDAGRGPPFWALPVMALWANLHESFLFGLALAAFLGGEAVLQPGGGRSRWGEARLWGAFVLAAVAAALLTPHGVEGLLQPIRLMRMPTLQSTFVEWRSPNFQELPAFDLWIVGLVAIGFMTGARLPLTRLVLLLGFVYMMLQHARHADVLAIAGPLGVAASLGARLKELTATPTPSRLTRWAARLARPPTLPATALSLALAAAFAVPIILHPIVRGDDAATPGTALAAARRMGLSGPVFNSEGFGGYLIFRGVPTFIDGRIEMYGDAFLAKDFQAQFGDEKVLKTILARYHIAWALLQPDDGAVHALASLPGWRRVYADKYAVVYRRTAAAGALR
jgi:hypothetical protein